MNGRLGPVLVLIVIGGCAGNSRELAARDAYWSGEVRDFFSSPHSLDDLHAWLRWHDVYYTFDDSNIVNGHWAVEVETVYSDWSSCEFWHVTLDVMVSGAKEITGYSLKRLGTCWYGEHVVSIV